MLIRTEFRVIHWEFDIPNDLSLAPFSHSILRHSILRIGNTGRIVGIRLRWTLRLKTDQKQLLNYIAEDDYFFSDFEDITSIDIGVMLKASHSNYSDEYNRRKVPLEALDLTKLYYPHNIDPEKMYSAFQSSKNP